MDKYEYQLKTEHIRQVAARKEYQEASKLCDTIDWTKIRDVKMLTLAADVYTAVGEYDKAIDILQQAYQYATMGRRIVYRLTELALKAGSYDDAKNYFDEFCRIAPNDQGRYILLYKMARFQKATLEEKIQILEAYKKEDFDEKWAYELAVLYAMNNEKEKCIQLCDDIILWFGLGKYVEKALSLKSQFAPLTPAQKEKAQKFADKKAKEEEQKRQEKQKEQEQKNSQEQQAEKQAIQAKISKWQEEQEKAYQAEQEAAKEEAKAREDEQRAALEREQKLREQRDEEKARKEEQERDDARKAAQRLEEQKEREEQLRLQREQEEREAVERLKKAQKQERASRSVVTSDMNEIMAVIQRAKQEDAQEELQETLAQQVQQAQLDKQEEIAADKENANEPEEIEEAIEVSEETPENAEFAESAEVAEIPDEKAKSQETPELAQETPELASDMSSSVETEEELQIPESVSYAQEDTVEAQTPEEAAWFQEYPSGDEPQISEWEAPKAETVEFEEADDVQEEPEITSDYEMAETIVEEAAEKVEPEAENTAEEEAEGSEQEEPAQEEESFEEENQPEVQEERAEEVEDESFEEKPSEGEEESVTKTPAEEYEERRQIEHVGNAGLPIVNPEDLSRVWHFAIQAMPNEDDIELALEYLQELAESSPRAVPQSVVKITGQKLNQKGLIKSFDKLLGKTILIENAADMNERVINEFCKIIDPNDRSLLVVFIDTPASIRHLLIEHPQLAQTVTAQFVRETYSVSELLEYARGYADREDSVLDKSGELALMERLKVISENQERNKKRIVEMIVNNAIEKAEKKKMRKLFQSKYDKRGCLILRDKDFEVG